MLAGLLLNLTVAFKQRRKWWLLRDGRRYYGTHAELRALVRRLFVAEPFKVRPAAKSGVGRKAVAVRVVEEARPERVVTIFVPEAPQTEAVLAERRSAERELVESQARERYQKAVLDKWDDEALVLLLAAT